MGYVRETLNPLIQKRGHPMDFIKTHPYLIANIPLFFLILTAAKTVQPRNFGRLSLLSGLVCMPCSVLALLHNESYWNPIRLGNGPIGIEDFVFTFVSGTMIWLLAAWPFRRRLLIESHLSTWARRSAFCSLLFGCLCTLLWFSGVKSLENTLLAGMLILFVILLLDHNLWPLAVSGVIFFVPVYLLIVKVQFSVWPDYLLYWNPHSALGITLIGIPMGELAHAIIFAAFWPVYIAYVFNIHLENS
jgi:hypothetical protein